MCQFVFWVQSAARDYFRADVKIAQKTRTCWAFCYSHDVEEENVLMCDYIAIIDSIPRVVLKYSRCSVRDSFREPSRISSRVSSLRRVS